PMVEKVVLQQVESTVERTIPQQMESTHDKKVFLPITKDYISSESIVEKKRIEEGYNNTLYPPFYPEKTAEAYKGFNIPYVRDVVAESKRVEPPSTQSIKLANATFYLQLDKKSEHVLSGIIKDTTLQVLEA
ncbi:MAG TPA: hypothetical protein P5513_04240, partial [Candidatus Diapherotrites archaeon]|nr:hypothetical protein [Candidatus Diapherotrites archaeon]